MENIKGNDTRNLGLKYAQNEYSKCQYQSTALVDPQLNLERIRSSNHAQLQSTATTDKHQATAEMM